jgi:hypothetical protein
MEALKAVPDLRAAVEAIERKWLDEGYSTAIEGNISVDLLFAAADRSFGDLRKHVKAIDLDRYPSEYPTCVARRSYGQRPVSLEPFWPESPCGARHHLVTRLTSSWFLSFSQYAAPVIRHGLLSGMINSHRRQKEQPMGTAVKKTISLPPDLARDAEALARAEGKTLSAVIQDALRLAGIERRLQELRDLQGYWSRQAREKGILSEQDLERYLRQ